MAGFVYILNDDRGRYYVGSTDNWDRRIKQHKTGHTWSTQRLLNPRIVFFQGYPTLQDARKVELRLKKLKRKDYLEKIVKDGFIKIKP